MLKYNPIKKEIVLEIIDGPDVNNCYSFHKYFYDNNLRQTKAKTYHANPIKTLKDLERKGFLVKVEDNRLENISWAKHKVTLKEVQNFAQIVKFHRKTLDCLA